MSWKYTYSNNAVNALHYLGSKKLEPYGSSFGDKIDVCDGINRQCIFCGLPSSAFSIS